MKELGIYESFIHRSRYARYLDREQRRENWEETVTRYTDFIEEWIKENHNYSIPNKDEIKNAILNHEVMPSMRAMMTAGKALKRDSTCSYNCSYLPVDDIKSFDEAMFILMCGAGVGFSVERQYVNKLPEIPDKLYDSDTTIIVKDSKEGWAKALRQLIALLYSGEIATWNLSKLRPKGSRLKTFGGRSSGPEPLDDLFNFTVNTFKNAVGRKLTSLECHDIMCKIGEVVVVGGVRRSAMISLSNLSDDRMRDAKTGAWWEAHSQRALSNNSAVYTEKPDVGMFMEEWLSLYKSKSGERGIFNREASTLLCEKYEKRDPNHEWGTNPCFSGDTLVAVADGRNAVSIKELAEEGLDVPVYSVNPTNGQVEIKWGRSPRKTRENAEIVKITLDDNSVIKCTPDHSFITLEGNRVSAKDLKKGDSLPRFMKRKEPMTQGGSDYARVNTDTLDPRKSSIYEHRMIARFHDEKKFDSLYDPTISNGFVKGNVIVHHKDYNSLNNSYDNLEIMTSEEHAQFHGKSDNSGENNPMSGKLHSQHTKKLIGSKAKERFKDPKFIQMMHDNLYSNEKFKKTRSVNMKKMRNKKIAEDQLSILNNPAYLEYDMSIVDERIKVKKTCPSCNSKLHLSWGERHKVYCSSSCAIKHRHSIDNSLKLAAKKSHENKAKSNLKKQIDIFNTLKIQLNRTPMKKEWEDSCKENKISFRFNAKSENPYILSCFKELKEHALTYNHKVISVEYLDEKEDVYNITTDDNHTIGIVTKQNYKKFICDGIFTFQCSEIILRPNEFCNLTEVVIRAEDTVADLERKVTLATQLGTYQSCFTHFPYLRKTWTNNCEEERLLGVSLTGICDNHITNDHTNKELPEILTNLRLRANKENADLSKKLKVNSSAAITCVKPSGTISQLTNSASGIHPRHSKYYLRRVRNSMNDPLTQFLMESGVPHEQDVMNPNNMVFTFPIKAPEDAKTRDDISSIDHLKLWLLYQRHYCEHKPSVTITVSEEEWPAVGAWVWENFDDISGISFLPYDGGTYRQMPYEACDEETYNKYKELIPSHIDWDSLIEYDDNGEGSQTLACHGAGGCEL